MIAELVHDEVNRSTVCRCKFLEPPVLFKTGWWLFACEFQTGCENCPNLQQRKNNYFENKGGWV
jgi:hypothetical protein